MDPRFFRKYIDILEESSNLDEGILPDYFKYQKSQASKSVTQDEISTRFRIGSQHVNVMFTKAPTYGGISKDFLKLLKPEYAKSPDKLLNAWEIGFSTGSSPDEMTDQKNTGNPKKEALAIFRAIAYFTDDIFDRHRSMLPIVYFGARYGENRDQLYEKLFVELAKRNKSRGYIVIPPRMLFSRTGGIDNWWIFHGSVFNEEGLKLIKSLR